MNNQEKFRSSPKIDSSCSAANRLITKLAGQLRDQQMPVTYNRGAILALKGSAADFLFWIDSGLIKVYCPLPDGARIMVRLVGPGEVVGYINGQEAPGRFFHLFELEAFKKSTVIFFPRERIIRLLKSLDQAKLIVLLNELNAAWSCVAAQFVTFFGMPYEKRLHLIFKDLSSRFGVKEARGALIVPELSHSDLAEMIGSSRPMVTRLIAAMTMRGELIRQGRHYVIPKALVEEASTMAVPRDQDLNLSSQCSPNLVPRQHCQQSRSTGPLRLLRTQYVDRDSHQSEPDD